MRAVAPQGLPGSHLSCSSLMASLSQDVEGKIAKEIIKGSASVGGRSLVCVAVEMSRQSSAARGLSQRSVIFLALMQLCVQVYTARLGVDKMERPYRDKLQRSVEKMTQEQEISPISSDGNHDVALEQQQNHLEMQPSELPASDSNITDSTSLASMANIFDQTLRDEFPEGADEFNAGKTFNTSINYVTVRLCQVSVNKPVGCTADRWADKKTQREWAI